MAQRLSAVSGRIIISKAGFDASPALPDANKIFDSDWFATGMIAFSGSVAKPSDVPVTITFPFALHYVPAAEVILSDGRSVPATVSASGIVVDPTFGSDTLFYTVWAISQ